MGCDAYDYTVLVIKYRDTDKSDTWIEIECERRYFYGNYDSDEEGAENRAFQDWLNEDLDPDKILYENGAWKTEFIRDKYSHHISKDTDYSTILSIVKHKYREER